MKPVGNNDFNPLGKGVLEQLGMLQQGFQRLSRGGRSEASHANSDGAAGDVKANANRARFIQDVHQARTGTVQVDDDHHNLAVDPLAQRKQVQGMRELLGLNDPQVTAELTRLIEDASRGQDPTKN